MDPTELERLLDRELKELPRPRAPETLMPRVMAAVGLAVLPWYRRPWVSWPVAWQGASAILLAAMLAGIVVLIPALQQVGSALLARVAGTVPRNLIEVARKASEAAALMKIVSQALLQPVAIYIFALAVSLSVACSALWSALNHAALGGASQQ